MCVGNTPTAAKWPFTADPRDRQCDLFFWGVRGGHDCSYLLPLLTRSPSSSCWRTTGAQLVYEAWSHHMLVPWIAATENMNVIMAFWMASRPGMNLRLRYILLLLLIAWYTFVSLYELDVCYGQTQADYMRIIFYYYSEAQCQNLIKTTINIRSSRIISQPLLIPSSL